MSTSTAPADTANRQARSATGMSRGIRSRRSSTEPTTRSRVIAGILGWGAALLFFFPVLWMFLNAFKEEAVANSSPTIFFTPTLDRFREVLSQSTGLLGAGEAFTNSAVIVGTSVIITMVLAVPAAYALSIKPIKQWRDLLFFFISTKFLPIVGSILPLWIVARNLDLLNTWTVLIILYTAMNLPLAIWMLRSFFSEVPVEMLEAAQLDGAGLLRQIRYILLPIVIPGLTATALLCLIFAWNEFFFAVQLNPVDGSTVPIWVTSNVSTRGNFLAKLSAASTLATLPVIIAGWIAQKRMIRGLAMGAIK